MKAPYLLSLAFLFLFFSAEAQLTFGIKGSFIEAKQVLYDSKTASIPGLGTTLILYKKVNKFLEIGMEPGIVQRGTGQHLTQGYYYYAPITFCGFGCYTSSYYPTNNPTNGLKTTYFQAPLMTRIGLPLAKGKMAIFGKIGGGPSWLANGYYESEVLDENTFEIKPETRELEFTEETGINRWEWGFYSGGGIGYNLGCGMLTFETEFYRGMTGMSEYTDLKNRSISYSLGFSVKL